MRGYIALLGIIIIILVITIGRIYNINTTEKKASTIIIDSLIQEIRYSRWKDSIYWVHIGKCSFISNGQIVITKDRYVKVKQSSKQGK